MMEGVYHRAVNDHQLQILHQAIDDVYREHGQVYCQITERKRSLQQNALSHVWYHEIDRAKRWHMGEARRYCKLRLGVPILRADSDEFRDAWDRILKHNLDYKEKLELMDWFPITRLMNVAQMAEYMTQLQQHFADEGVVLE